MIIGLDVGGTHTYAVLLSNKGVEKSVRVTTDHADLFTTVLSGFTQLLESIDPAQIERAVISTTLTTNAIIQQTMEPVGMVVSAGPGIDPEFFRTGEHYYAVSGSINHRGREKPRSMRCRSMTSPKKWWMAVSSMWAWSANSASETRPMKF